MKDYYVGTLQDVTTTPKEANPQNLGYATTYSRDKKKLIAHMVNQLEERQKGSYVQVKEVILDDEKLPHLYCVKYVAISKTNLLFRQDVLLTVSKIEHEAILD